MKWRGTYHDTKWHWLLRNGLASWWIWGGFTSCPSPWVMVFYVQIVSLLLVLTAIERRGGQ